MDAPGARLETVMPQPQPQAAHPPLRWIPPPVPVFATSKARAPRTEGPRAESPDLRLPPLPQPSARLNVAPQQASPPAFPVPHAAPAQVPRTAEPGAEATEPYLLDLAELRATRDATPRPTPRDAVPRAEPRLLMQRVARIQVIVAIVVMLAAPLLTLATGRTSALAFALHGIGAMLLFGVATLAMHQAYPLLRGGSRTWPAFKTSVARLAACAVTEGISGVWLLYYYHSETGPGHALAESAPLVDQLAMNIKLYCGLAAVLLSIAAWWSARLVSDDRKSGMMVPALATAGAWIAMVCAFALGLGIAWVMPA